MEESFNLVAQSRVNYYTPGSPVQVVRVELLRGSESQDNAVCLSFKNIRDEMLTGLKVHFRCKGADGNMLFEDDFRYDDLNAENGVVFGMDDAVYVTPNEIGSIDVALEQAWYGRKSVDLTGFERVRLPAPKKLPKEVAHSLQQQSGRKEMKYMPQILENGWYCACGAFHSNEENTVYCSECGSDRILLQNAITSILQPEQPVSASNEEEPTQVVTRHGKNSASADEDRTRVVASQATQAHMPTSRPYAAAKPLREEEEYNDYEDYDDEEDPRDVLAEKLIRVVPAVTAVLCALIAVGGFVYCKVIL